MDAAGTRKGGLFGQPVPIASRCGMLPREEGEDRAGMPLLVAVVEVVRVGVVEIDGLLHEAEPEDARVKLQVSGCAPGDGGDVMDAGHGELLSGAASLERADDRRHRSSVMWSWLPSMTMRSKQPGDGELGFVPQYQFSERPIAKHLHYARTCRSASWTRSGVIHGSRLHLRLIDRT